MKTAIQLFTLCEFCEKDLKGTLQKVAEAGYDGVELFRLHGYTPQEVRAMLDEYCLQAVSTHHIGIDDWEQNFEENLQAAKTLGLRYSIMPCANLSTEDEWHDLARRLNVIGEKLRKEGIRYGYHNHEHEIKLTYGDKTAMDILMEDTDPQNVVWQMDTGLVRRCGGDPVKFAEKYADRIPLIHARDIDENGGYCVESGRGVVAIDKVAHTIENGLEWLIVEHAVEPEKVFESIRISAENMNRICNA